jgi:hypothetical protein
MKMLRVVKKWVRVDFIFGMVGWWCGFGGVRGGLGGLWICNACSERKAGGERDGWVGGMVIVVIIMIQSSFFLLSCSGLGWACSAFRVSKY